MSTINIHSKYCCHFHGCRFYNNEACPVAKGNIAQTNKCGENPICSEYRISDISEIDENPYNN